MLRILVLLVAAGVLAGCQTLSPASFNPAADPKLAAAGWREIRSPQTVSTPYGSARVEKALVCLLPTCGGLGRAGMTTWTSPPQAPGQFSLGQFAQTVQLSDRQLEAMLKLGLAAGVSNQTTTISNVRRAGNTINFDFTCEPKAMPRLFTTGHAVLAGDRMVVTYGAGSTPQSSRERLRLASGLH
jgi:hypothetical protein